MSLSRFVPFFALTTRCVLLLPACGEKVGMREPNRKSQNRGRAPSPGLLRNIAMLRIAFLRNDGGRGQPTPLPARRGEGKQKRSRDALLRPSFAKDHAQDVTSQNRREAERR
jgi:hypothetical protein